MDGRALHDVGFEALFRAVLNRLRARGLSIEEIRKTVDGYWFISATLKEKLKRYLDLWGAERSRSL